MKRLHKIKHKFVENIPDQMEAGILYVSMEFATAIHLCACGCGHEVVTPITPDDWSLIFNGKTISLTPSIGNYSFPCQSHYWIRSGRIEWVEQLHKRENTQRKHRKKWGDGFWEIFKKP
jgi:hypothetical protein